MFLCCETQNFTVKQAWNDSDCLIRQDVSTCSSADLAIFLFIEPFDLPLEKNQNLILVVETYLIEMEGVFL